MFIGNNSAQLYTVDFGAGPRTILAHGGWTGSWELWLEPFMHLSKNWRTVAYDHRGTGATIAPLESISIETMVDDLFAVMDKMNIKKCVLAAESAGGMVAVTAALQRPDRFEGLVLVDAMLHNEKRDSDTLFVRGLRSNFEQTIGQFVDACVPQEEAFSAEIRLWGRKILQRATPAASVKLLECTFGVDLRPQLSELRIPTLILHGDHDVIVPPSDSEFAASQIPNSRLHMFKGAGHVPTMTRPQEVAAEIERAFGAR